MPDDTAIWLKAPVEPPALDEEAFGLVQRVYASPDEGRPCLAAAFRVPGRLAGMYGGRITGAIQIVAVDARSGEVHYREAEPRTGIPLVPRSPEGLMLPSAVSGSFGVDLAGHLDLPPERRRYHVFLWLDEMVSPVAVVETPGADPEVEAGVDTPAASPFTLARVPPRTNARGEAQVRLAAARAEDGIRIEGFAHLPRPVDRDEPAPLVVLGLCDATHRLGGAMEPVRASLEEAITWRFEIGVEHLIPARAEPRRLHVVALAFGVLSPVLSVDLAPR